MAVGDNSFPRLSMVNALPYPKGISSVIPPPGFAPRVSTTSLGAALFNLMTSGEGVALFKDMILKLEKTELLRLAALLRSDLDYFMAIVTNKYGSKRVQKLLGKTDDVDVLFCSAILHCFLHVMTDKYASHVAIRAMAVFDEEKKKLMYERILHHALDIACDQQGCIALNDIITDADDLYYKNKILDVVAFNALYLSNDDSGNFVVQHVLTLNDMRTTYNIAFTLTGHFIELSFNKYGSYIVEKLLEAEMSRAEVLAELLECKGDMLMKLARNEFGNFVVSKALRLTMSNINQFCRLEQKLMPFLHLLRRSHGSNIANILESL